MGMFSEVVITWAGTEYKVPPDKVMGLIASIEEHITIEDLVGKGVKRAKLAEAFCAALNYAGARVTSDDVYVALFSDKGLTTANTITAILSIMVPPKSVEELAPTKKPLDQPQEDQKSDQVAG